MKIDNKLMSTAIDWHCHDSHDNNCLVDLLYHYFRGKVIFLQFSNALKTDCLLTFKKLCNKKKVI